MNRACSERELKFALDDVEYLCSMLRRIQRLEPQDAAKYAAVIAREALETLPKT